MKEFLWDYRYIIVIIIAALIYCLFNWQKVKTLALQGMLKAKSLAKDAVLHSGQEQEDWVVSKIYPMLPNVARLFISEGFFRILVQKLYKTAKDLIDDGKLNGTDGGAV